MDWPGPFTRGEPTCRHRLMARDEQCGTHFAEYEGINGLASTAEMAKLLGHPRASPLKDLNHHIDD